MKWEDVAASHARSTGGWWAAGRKDLEWSPWKDKCLAKDQGGGVMIDGDAWGDEEGAN